MTWRYEGRDSSLSINNSLPLRFLLLPLTKARRIARACKRPPTQVSPVSPSLPMGSDPFQRPKSRHDVISQCSGRVHRPYFFQCSDRSQIHASTVISTFAGAKRGSDTKHRHLGPRWATHQVPFTRTATLPPSPRPRLAHFTYLAVVAHETATLYAPGLIGDPASTQRLQPEGTISQARLGFLDLVLDCLYGYTS